MQKFKDAAQAVGNVGSSTLPDQPSQSRRIIKILAIVFLSVCLIGGIIYVGWAGYEKYFANTPEKILQKALASMQNITSLSYNVNVGAAIDVQDWKAKDTYNILSSTMITEDDGAVATRLSVDGNLYMRDSQLIKTKANVTLEVWNKGVMNGIFVFTPEGLYVKINSLPTPKDNKTPSLANYIIGKWIQLPISMGSEINTKDVAQVEAKFDLASIIRTEAPNVFTVNKYLGVEDVNGASSYHVVLDYDKKAMGEFLQKITTDLSKQYPSIQPNNFTEIDDWRNTTLTIDVWVNKKTYILEQIQIISDYSSLGKSPSHSVIMLNGFNQPVDISTPSDAVSIIELMSMAMPFTIKSMQLPNINIKTQSLPLKNITK